MADHPIDPDEGRRGLGASSTWGGGKGSGRRRPPYGAVLAGYAALVVLTTVVAMMGSGRRGPVIDDQRPWIAAWLVGDATWYQRIANDGYFYVPGQQSSVAFFPTYPLSVRGVGRLFGGDYHLAGWLVSTLAGGAAVLAFTAWVWPRLPRPAAITAVALLMLYPYSFFLYGAMYSDSLFLLLAIGAFLLVERRQFWWAGLIGALATAGRPVGVAVAVGSVVRVLEMLATAGLGRPTAAERPGRWWPDRARLGDLFRAIPRVRWREAGILLSGLGLAAWCTYLWIAFGDPVAFASVQGAPGWNQGGGPRTWFKVQYLGLFVYGWNLDLAVRLSAQALMVLLAILLLRRVWRLFGWGYLAYAVVVLAIPLIGTKDFMGTGRYVLAAFPVIAAGGHLLATIRFRWVRPVVLGLFGAGLLVATFVFASGVAVT